MVLNLQSNLERDCLRASRQRKYSQSVKDQGEDVRGTRLRPALLSTFLTGMFYLPAFNTSFVLKLTFVR